MNEQIMIGIHLVNTKKTKYMTNTILEDWLFERIHRIDKHVDGRY